jgi:hypothetical protein
MRRSKHNDLQADRKTAAPAGIDGSNMIGFWGDDYDVRTSVSSPTSIPLHSTMPRAQIHLLVQVLMSVRQELRQEMDR